MMRPAGPPANAVPRSDVDPPWSASAPCVRGRRLGQLRAQLVGTAPTASAAGVSVTPDDRAFVSQLDGSVQKFVVLWPDGFDRSKPTDVLIALHGHGSDRWQFVDAMRGECLGAREVAARHKMVYVSPDYRAPTSWMGPAATADMVQLIHLLREELMCVRRVVVCGGSMGGTGALVFATLCPSMLDGVVSLNGTADMVVYENFPDAIDESFGALEGQHAVARERQRRSAALHPERLAGLVVASTTGGLDESVPPASTLELLKVLQAHPPDSHKPPVLSIHRPGVGHETDYADTTAALEFTLASLGDRHTIIRSSFANSLQRLQSDSARVAFMGGSITQMDGFRPLLCHWLESRFVNTSIDFVQAGISSTCSTTGAFRLEQDVLDAGRIDLFVLEFAVNDDQDAKHESRECIRGMEGIIRHARTAQPDMDIVVVYFVNESMLASLQSGDMPTSIAAHEQVCSHYGVSSVLLANYVARQITRGQLSWDDYGGVHPAPAGNAIAAKLCEELLCTAWHRESNGFALPAPHHVPPMLRDAGSYTNGRWLLPNIAQNESWKWGQPDWEHIDGSFRDTFADKPLLCGSSPGVETAPIRFEGNVFGAFVLAGPDAGIVECSIDGHVDTTTAVDLFHSFSIGLHYPRTVLFAAGLNAGHHEARLRIRKRGSREAGGNVARILQFCVNPV